MKIDHIAIRTHHLERLKSFYEVYFHGKPGEKYINPRKNFESYFIHFDDGMKLELIEINDLSNDIDFYKTNKKQGFVHMAFSAGNKENVDSLTHKLREDGYIIASEPRTTGDGFYESVVLDPDGNNIEITE